MLPTTTNTSPTSYHHQNRFQKFSTPPDKKSWLKWVPLAIVIVFFMLAYYQQYLMAQSFTSVDESGWPLRLKKGWFFGRKMDLSDSQWRSFRQFFPLLVVACIIYCMCSSLLFRLFQGATSSVASLSSMISNSSSSSSSSNSSGDVSKARLLFYAITSLAFIIFLFRFNAVHVLLVAIVNYRIGVSFKGSKFQPALTWIFTLIILVTSDYYDGYSRLSLRFLNLFGPRARFWYFSHSGLVNWSTYFNISMCRLISYNMDLRSTFVKMQQMDTLSDSFNSSPTEKENTSGWAEYRRRQEEPRSLYDYNFIHYFIYVFYVPCYIAGPICSFDAFISYLYTPQKEVSRVKLIRMSIGVAVYTLLLEISLHFGYYVGFNDERCWRTDGYPICAQIMNMNSIQIGTTGLLTLAYMYLKFTIIWRFFRVWALWDGQNVPENMTDCVFNNFLVTQFWRNWHRSMYLWIVKYMYIPLGGSRTRLFSAWLIFGFIAIWHDLWWRWVAWAYFNAFLMCIEVIFTQFIAPKILKYVTLSGYRKKLAIAAIGSLNGTLLFCANLAIMYGFEGTYHFLGSIVLWGDMHQIMTPLVFIALFCALLGIFEIREVRGLTEKEKEKEKQ